MFQSLRASNQFYILHKESVPYIEIGSVVSVSAPMPKFAFPQTFGQPQEMVVDVVVRVNDNNVTFQKLPANQEIADFGMNGSIVVATSKDAMNAELSSLRQKSIDIINSVNFHKSVIEGCDKTLRSLNPEYAEKQQQQEEITVLKQNMEEMRQNMANLMKMQQDFFAKFSGGIPSAKNTGNMSSGNDDETQSNGSTSKSRK